MNAQLIADVALKGIMIGALVFLSFYMVICGIDLYKYLSGKYPEPKDSIDNDDDSDLGIFMQ